MQPNMNKDALSACLHEATGLSPSWTADVRGNPFGWLRVAEPSQLEDAAKALAGLGVRLCTITAYAELRDDAEKRRAIAYHFTLQDTMLTVTVPLYHADTLEKRAAPSITPWFRNADWNEREFMEMFNIEISGHPNPKRLFLDERIDAGIMTKLVPFSAMVNGASSQTLWERVMQAKTGGVSNSGGTAGAGGVSNSGGTAGAPLPPLVEPQFTPVSATAGEAVPPVPSEGPVSENLDQASGVREAQS